MQDEAPHRYRFDEFTLDVARACLLRGGEQVNLRPKAFDALRYLLENRGRVATKDELMQALWPKVVVTDDSLVKCIQEVREALGDADHRYLKTVPRRGYLFDATVTATDDAGTRDAAASPLIATAPEPLAMSSSENDLPATAGRPARRLVAAATAIALVLIAAGIAYRWGAPQDAKAVAVLPLENLSPDANNEYFAAGVHESILNQLAKIDGIKTVARTTMLRYSGVQKSIPEIAAELDVEAVVEGSVRYADDQVLVTAQLIDAQTGMHLWSEEYNRPLADIFAIQTDIATRIAVALDAELSPQTQGDIEREPTSSPAAYRLYLRGRYHADTGLAEDLNRSIEYFEQAIRLDPSYALAYAGLADAYSYLPVLTSALPIDSMQKAKAAAARALELDPNLPEAHIAMGYIKHFYDWDYEGGDADFERAIALAPNNAHAHHLYGKLLGDTFQWDKSLAELRTALELEPYSVTTLRDLGESLYFMRRYEDALEVFAKSLELEPDYPSAFMWMARCHEGLGRRDEAVRAYLRRLTLAGGFAGSGVTDSVLAEMEHAFVTGGWDGFWRAELARLTARRATVHVEPFRFVEAHVRLGQFDEAFEWLETSAAERSVWFPIVASDPLLEPLTTDPRYERILRLANHERYWSGR